MEGLVQQAADTFLVIDNQYPSGIAHRTFHLSRKHRASL
ncbi:hypothetical protein HM1_1073 [Heliomicrobium modesticaldum Ice1]|uniref:Uncharacterized protein n=1 Tax=Heliobacterium modesticaldum (strain ATCC 51547 / Ice1) TaxID=498761 RepID=B0TI81_HELMI|nr:hypothetical protein HM1_1073 [Heliomicrobium modesticaldum Ice1]